MAIQLLRVAVNIGVLTVVRVVFANKSSSDDDSIADAGTVAGVGTVVDGVDTAVELTFTSTTLLTAGVVVAAGTTGVVTVEFDG